MLWTNSHKSVNRVKVIQETLSLYVRIPSRGSKETNKHVDKRCFTGTVVTMSEKKKREEEKEEEMSNGLSVLLPISLSASPFLSPPSLLFSLSLTYPKMPKQELGSTPKETPFTATLGGLPSWLG